MDKEFFLNYQKVELDNILEKQESQALSEKFDEEDNGEEKYKKFINEYNSDDFPEFSIMNESDLITEIPKDIDNKNLLYICSENEVEEREQYQEFISVSGYEEVRNVLKDIKSYSGKIVLKNIANQLKQYMKFINIKDRLYCYKNDIYISVNEKKQEFVRIIREIAPQNILEQIQKYRDFIEIYNWLCSDPELFVDNFEEEMERNATCIPFQNGLYDIATGKFLEYSEERLLFYKLKANYIGRNCDLPPVWNNFLFGMSPVDKEISTILCQMILNCLLIGNKSKTFALMLPSPNSGKSVLGNALIEIIGREHITTRSFSELSKRFGLANLEGMALNICMEADTNLNKAAIRCMKGLTGENYINSEAKGVNHKVIYNNAKFVFGVNDIPILEEMDEAFFNRLQCIPMMYSIPIDQQDKFLLQKLIEEADEFLSWLVNNETTEQFVYNNFSYSYCKQAEELKQAIKERCENNRFLDAENDMVQEFIDLCIEQTGNKKDFISNQILYLAYQAFCKEKNLFQICEPKAFSRKFAKFGIGIKSKSYDPKIESKSPLNGFKGIRLIDEVIEFQ